MGEEKPIVGSAIRKIAMPAVIHDRRPEMVVQSRGFLPREGTLGREIFERVTVLGVEAILAAFAGSRSGKNRNVARAREATGVSEVGRRKKRKRMRGSREGRKLPTKPGDPPKRSGRRETLDSSVLVGATRQVHAGRKV